MDSKSDVLCSLSFIVGSVSSSTSSLLFHPQLLHYLHFLPSYISMQHHHIDISYSALAQDAMSPHHHHSHHCSLLLPPRYPLLPPAPCLLLLPPPAPYLQGALGVSLEHAELVVGGQLEPGDLLLLLLPGAPPACLAPPALHLEALVT